MNSISQSLSKNRIHYLDVAKAIGIILVIVGHIEKNHLSESVSGFIFSFHMPLFFIVSGMIIRLKKEAEEPLFVLLKKKACALLVPYFWFSLIYIIIDIVRLIMGYDEPTVIISALINTFTLYADSTLWFLPALFIADITFIILNNRLKSLSPFVFIGMAAIGYIIEKFWLKSFGDSIFSVIFINIMSVFIRGFIATVFVMIGFMVFNIIPKEKPAIIKRIIAFVSGAVALTGVFFLSKANITVDMRRIELGMVPVFFLTSVLGTLGVTLISVSIWKLKFLEFFGRNTLIIMCSHLNFYILFWSMQYALFLNNYINHAKSYIFVLNVVIACLLMETVLIFIIRKCFPFVIGRKHGRKS